MMSLFIMDYIRKEVFSVSSFARILIVLFPALLASFFGLLVVFPKTKGEYYRMPIMALVCLLVGELSYTVLFITGNYWFDSFNLGSLGSLAAALFFLTGNAGSASMLAEDVSVKSRKPHILGLCASGFMILTLLITEFFWVKPLYQGSSAFWHITIQYSLITLVGALTVYFTAKAALQTYSENSFGWCMKPYNITVTLFFLISGLERITRGWEELGPVGSLIFYSIYIVFGLTILIMIPLLERGRSKFLTL